MQSGIRRSPRSAATVQPLESRTLLTAAPFPFTPVSIGPTNVAGTSSYSSPTLTITAANQDAFSNVNSIDSVYYVYAELIGNGSITTRVTDDLPDPNGTDPLAGVDIRSTLDPSAPNVFLANRSGVDVVANNRTTQGSNGVNQSVAAVSQPVYVELQRSGDVITESYSTDGSSYTTLAPITLPGLPTDVLIGFAQGSQDESVATTALYDHIATTGELVSAASGIAGPTATSTLSNITAGSGQTYDFPVTYASSNYVSAASIGNSNIVVTGPNGYTQTATVVSSPTADATSLTAHYELNPAPSYPGTYTVTLKPNQVSDPAGNFSGGQTLGTFTVPFIPSVTGTITNAKTGTPLPGVRVYFDLGHTGTETAADPWALTDSNGFYEFGPAGNNTYRVAVNNTVGETVATPTAGFSTQNTVLDATQTGVNFTINIPGSAVTGTFSSVPTSIKRGKQGRLTILLTNTGSSAATGTISIELASNTLANGTGDIVFKTFKEKIKLAADASVSVPETFTVPKKSTPAGNRYVLALIDPGEVIDKVTDVVVSTTAIPFS